EKWTEGIPSGGDRGVNGMLLLQHNRVTSFSRWHLELPYLLTLGVVPDGSTLSFELAGRAHSDNSETPILFEYTEESIIGWAACFLWFRSDWHRAATFSDGEASRAQRAFYTVINRLAKEER
ncbi:MAG: hypothetical protein P1V35_09845, partial [Planctomycetota bacterium]|nr:hypothetical protein [Planctomycetota bacterium]